MTEMDRGARAWLVTVAADHYWRVAAWYEFDDLIQDGYMCWYRVVAKYESAPDRVRSLPHLMRLFKITFLNHIHTLSKNKTVASIEVKADDVVREPTWDVWSKIAPPRNIDDLALLIADAPAILQPVLAMLYCGIIPSVLRATCRVRDDGSRQTLNDKLCRAIGADPDTDLVTELRSFLRD